MKKIMCVFVLSSFVINSFCQETLPEIKDQTFYLQKSKSQKTVAWIMLSGGVTAFIVGSAIAVSDNLLSALTNPDQPNDSYGGQVMAVVGLAAILGSIPIFISAAKNHRRAITLNFDTQRIVVPFTKGFAFRTQPIITLNIPLRNR